MLDATDATAWSAASAGTRCVQLVDIGVAEQDRHWRNPQNVYSIQYWQPIPWTGRKAHTLFCSMTWRDQGWGNRKGKIAIVNDALSSEVSAHGGATAGPLPPPQMGDAPAGPLAEVVALEPAPHVRAARKLTICPAPQGPCSIWYRVGGGGGHELYVYGFSVRMLEYCNVSS